MSREDYKWVPRETYDKVMEKLDACVEENKRLVRELRAAQRSLAAIHSRSAQGR